VKGFVRPRIYTPEKRKLTPRTSSGYEVVKFASTLGVDLMPHQKLALVRGGELLPNGRPRFRVVLVLMSRQNGKTTLTQVLSLQRMASGAAHLVLGTSTNMEYAREAWGAAVDLAQEKLPDMIHPTKSIRRGALDTSLTLTNKTRYKIATATRTGGRSLAVDLGIADEIREHDTWDAWAAMSGATTARPSSQIWALSNAGEDRSVVLNHLRDAAVAYIETGKGDDTVCLLEWSAEDGCELDDTRGWRQANPALGYTIDEATLRSKLGTCPPNVFRTEHLCQRVETTNAAVDESAWRDGADRSMTLDGLRDKVCLCLDVSLDLGHITLAASAIDKQGRGRLEIVKTWSSTMRARHELPDLIAQVNPRAFGWFPTGPAAALVADLRGIRHGHEIKQGEVSAVCMGFAEQVQARRILHNGEELLTAHVISAAKYNVGDGWRFVRNGVGHVDAAYAAAGALHLARTAPARPRAVVLVGRRVSG